MSIELWVAYTLATIIILVIPGPTIILVVSQAATHGSRSVMPLTAGVVAGDLTAMTMSLLGLGAVLSASAILFTVFKIIGAIYLIYLGISLWRADPGTLSHRSKPQSGSPATLFRRSYIVTALNPKGIAFFVAFLPQFINPALPILRQLVIMGATFLCLALLNALLYGFFASRLAEIINKSSVRRWLNRCGGGALIGAGIWTAAMHRNS